VEVECVNNEFAEELLTVGKAYKVFYHMERQYAVINDTGSVSCHAKSKFQDTDLLRE
jgi:hypothetical protein